MVSSGPRAVTLPLLRSLLLSILGLLHERIAEACLAGHLVVQRNLRGGCVPRRDSLRCSGILLVGCQQYHLLGMSGCAGKGLVGDPRLP